MFGTKEACGFILTFRDILNRPSNAAFQSCIVLEINQMFNLLEILSDRYQFPVMHLFLCDICVISITITGKYLFLSISWKNMESA